MKSKDQIVFVKSPFSVFVLQYLSVTDSKMEVFVEIVNLRKPLTIFAKNCILDYIQLKLFFSTLNEQLWAGIFTTKKFTYGLF